MSELRRKKMEKKFRILSEVKYGIKIVPEPNEKEAIKLHKRDMELLKHSNFLNQKGEKKIE